MTSGGGGAEGLTKENTRFQIIFLGRLFVPVVETFGPVGLLLVENRTADCMKRLDSSRLQGLDVFFQPCSGTLRLETQPSKVHSSWFAARAGRHEEPPVGASD